MQKEIDKEYIRLVIFCFSITAALCESLAEVPLLSESILESGGGDPHEADEGADMENMWVHYALLDLAYYIRSHKFNEFDRRYMKDAKTAPKGYYKRFADPPLRTYHWEVHKHCSLGLIDCLRYSLQYINVAMLQKDGDPIYIARKKKWTWSKNKDDMKKANENCLRLFREDYDSPIPFVGPIHRFQWRTTISYYMCLFTLQGRPELSVFGEPCDNYAHCLVEGSQVSNNDPRADDKIPFNCAKYSFCPDPCCPMKKISSFDECVNHSSNPCPTDSPNRTCVFESSKNLDFFSLSRNHWNLTCKCREKGMRWNSRFGLCADINECEEGSDDCDPAMETCLNLRSSYSCSCAFGYSWNNETCEPMQHVMDQINEATLILRPNKTQLTKKQNKRQRLRNFFFGKRKEDDLESPERNSQPKNKLFVSCIAFIYLTLILFCKFSFQYF